MEPLNEQMQILYDKALVMGAEYGAQLISALLVLIIGLWIIGKISDGVRTYTVKGLPDETLAKFLTNIFEVTLKVILVISVASMVGIQTTSFVAIIGAAGLAVGLALQGSLSNFAGGVMLLIFRPIRVGDYVGAQGMEGTVTDIGIFVTTFETFDKRILIVPNGPLANGNITNYTKSEVRAVEVSIGISYSDDIAKGKAAMEDVLKNDARVLQDEGNVVAVVDLGNSSVDFLVRAFVKTDDYWSMFFDIRPALKSAIEAQGLTIPFPQRDVHIFQENN
ncbi:mechanosensitive ion channel [Paraglaciecola aquimarina]|uniref:Small-conductance mechanosensitive channel n=1 Tax=Paraglaciecola algarum TaxID=3050085 RepID=A0ABS9DCE0_9ALTE|nr:mechanosensitive ion channel domain-containing protein [Paraglaciecola sp. G1-23]MCF2950010.1 mechanosensitive ion channel [Paraglaciecola sp. G1-23]